MEGIQWNPQLFLVSSSKLPKEHFDLSATFTGIKIVQRH
jgi:hypothetical protein